MFLQNAHTGSDEFGESLALVVRRDNRRSQDMSCWVVPSLAADYLGITLDELMQRVNAGAMTIRSEDGFDMVDVAPDSPRQGKAAAPKPRPAGYPIGKPREPEGSFDADERDTFGDWRAARASTARTRKAPILN
jgi:hypothetical protein